MVKVPDLLSLSQRINFLDRADAVRRLQEVGEVRRAHVLQAGMLNEIDRLRGELRYTTPEVNAAMKANIAELTEKLKAPLPTLPPAVPYMRTKRVVKKKKR